MTDGSYMGWIDWLILVVPVIFVMGMGFHARRYIHGVSDFLACGRLCGRYVLTMGDIANALSIIGLVSFIEIKYKTGFALSFWVNILTPLSIFVALTGYVTYRFRETRSLSLGQFLEMRYSRPLREGEARREGGRLLEVALRHRRVEAAIMQEEREGEVFFNR